MASAPPQSKPLLVLKLGGAIVLDPLQVAVVAREVLAATAAGWRVAIVHGGGPQLDSALLALGESVARVEGLRVTSRPAAGVVRRVMDAIGQELAQRLRAHGVDAAHVASGEGRLAAHPKSAALGRVGTVSAFRADGLPGGVAVVTPVGFDGEGPLNVNADEGACAVATAMGAQWLVLGTDVRAVRGEQGQSLESLTLGEARRLMQAGAATGGMIPKLESASAALRGGVGRVLITRVEPGTLQRALEGRPEGTLVAQGVPA